MAGRRRAHREGPGERSASACGQVDESHRLIAVRAQPAAAHPPTERVAFLAAAGAQVALGARRALIHRGRRRRPSLGLGLRRLAPPPISGLAVGVAAVATPAPGREGDAAVQASHHNAIVTDGVAEIGAERESPAARAAGRDGCRSAVGPMARPKYRNAIVTDGFMAGEARRGLRPPGRRRQANASKGASW
jgi:hypothetical protein